MPTTGYDDEAQKVTLRTGTSTWRFKLGVLLLFAASSRFIDQVSWRLSAFAKNSVVC